MENAEVKQQEFDNLPEAEKANFIVQNISSDVILINLSMWLDMAIAKGRYIDSVNRKNAVSAPDNYKEQEISENE